MQTEREPAESQLVERARDGSLEAFNLLVDRYQDAVYALCRRLLADSAAAEDASQETFISAYRAIGSFAGGNFRSWLLRIAANQSKDELRKRQRRPRQALTRADDDAPPIDLPDPSGDVTFAIERAELGRQLEAALMQLSFEQRQAIVLADVHGYHYEEIAAIASCSIGTVKSRIARGRERLRVILLTDPEHFARFQRLASKEEHEP